MKNRLDAFDVPNEKVNKLNFADIWFNKDHISVLNVIHHPILFTPE